jgi:hypothetical protein
MSELEQFRTMLRLSAHEFTEEPLDEEEAPGYVVVQVVPDVHKQVKVSFTFNPDGDLSSMYPIFPSNWTVTVT